MNRRARALAVTLAAGLFLPVGIFACGDLLQEPDTGFASAFLITSVAGDDQSGPAGAVLPQPLRARITPLEGQPVERLWVEWVVLEGNGRVEPRNSFTNEEGIAETIWTLGPAPRKQRVMARFDGDSAMFEADVCEVCPEGD